MSWTDGVSDRAGAAAHRYMLDKLASATPILDPDDADTVESIERLAGVELLPWQRTVMAAWLGEARHAKHAGLPDESTPAERLALAIGARSEQVVAGSLRVQVLDGRRVVARISWESSTLLPLSTLSTLLHDTTDEGTHREGI